MSSKVISRSISFNYDLNLKRQRTAKGMPLLEEIFGPNTVSHKLSSSLETKATTFNEDGDGDEWDLGSNRVDPPKRSKSWHQFPQDGHQEEEFPWQGNGVVRSRSFHTVEEYDALLEKLLLTRSLQDDNENLEEEVEIIDVTESAIEDESLVVEEKDSGNKRHAVAKRLDSLKIPATIEFTAIGSLREWLQGGGKVYSPGTAYVTPKFGSYCSSNSKMNNESGSTTESGGYVFNPELVTAIEEHMQELEVEEETIIMQIADNWDGKIVSVSDKEKCITE